jgi:hypothetical protein
MTKHTVCNQATSLWLAGLVTALAMLPIFFFEIPAMNDYPNHLARMYLLTSTGTLDQNPYYYVYLPYIYPNLAMDIVVPILARLLDVTFATKVFLIVSQLLVVSGAVALEMAVKQRHEFAGFAGAALLYCLPFAWGFLNFEFGVGLALWGLASWLVLANRKPTTRVAAHALFCTSLYVSHLVAFALYGMTLGFYELWRAFQSNSDWRNSTRTLIILVAPAIIIMAYFFYSTANINTGTNEVGERAFEWRKFISIFHGMNGYNAFLSIGNIFAILVMTYFMLRKRYLLIMPQGRWIAVGFFILIVVLPSSLFGGDFLNLRIAVASLLISPAFLSFSPSSGFFRLIPPCVLSFITLANAGQMAGLSLNYRPEYAALQESFKRIQRDTFVLVGHANFKDNRFDKNQTPILSATALAAYYADAFVSTLVIIPGQQPLRVCPELKSVTLSNTKDYWPVDISVLGAVATGVSTSDIPTYVRNWVYDYDYLYLVGPAGPNPLPSRLTALTISKSFTLYRITKLPGEGNALIRSTVNNSRNGEPPPDGCLKKPRAMIP